MKWILLRWTMKTARIVMIGIVMAVLIGCQSNQAVKIGWIGPLTGPSAVLGMDSVTAAQIAVDEMNSVGKKAELLVEDDQYDASKTLSSYNKLVYGDGVKMLIVSSYSGVFAIAKQAESDGVIVIDPLDCNKEVVASSKNVLCLATESESIARVLASQAQGKTGVLYFDSDMFMPLVKKTFEQIYGVAVSEAYDAGTADFKGSISKMMDAGVESIVLLGYDETGIAMRQARDLGFTGGFYTTGTVTSPSLQEASKGAANSSVFAFWDAPSSEKSAAFLVKFTALKGKGPILDLASYPTYDATYALVELAGAEDVKSSANAMPAFEGAIGTVKFDESGAMMIAESAHRLADGKIEKV